MAEQNSSIGRRNFRPQKGRIGEVGSRVPASRNTTSRPIVFRARRLSKTYVMGDVKVHALHDIDLDIFERECVVLLGPSGSGKSTLLNILGGLDSPTCGEAAWRDHDLVGAGEAELTRYRREHVGFVFQFYNLIPSLTVLENMARRRLGSLMFARTMIAFGLLFASGVAANASYCISCTEPTATYVCTPETLRSLPTLTLAVKGSDGFAPKY